MTDDFNNYASGTPVNVGAVNNGGTLTTKGGLKCVNFSATTHYINLPSITSNTNGYTIAFSFYLTQLPSEPNVYFLFYNPTIPLSKGYWDNEFFIWHDSYSRINILYTLSMTFDNSILNKWNQFVITFNRSNVGNYYFNGNLIHANVSDPRPVSRSFSNCSIGLNPNATQWQNSPIGSFRNFLYYNNILTQSQVTTLYQNL